MQIEKIPTDTASFIELRDQIATTPEGGAAAFIVAMAMYAINPSTGLEAMIIQSDKNLLSPSNSGYKGFNFGSSASFLMGQFEAKTYIAGSYIQGTSPEQGYVFPTENIQIEISRNISSGSDSDGKVKVFIACTGADSPRPITLVKNDKGVWKAFEFSSLMVGVRPMTKKSGPEDGDF